MRRRRLPWTTSKGGPHCLMKLLPAQTHRAGVRSSIWKILLAESCFVRSSFPLWLRSDALNEVREAGGENESKLDKSFYPLEITPAQDEAWLEQVKTSLQVHPATE